MDLKKEIEAFEEKFPIPAHWIEFDIKRNKYFCPYCADAAANAYQAQWETWQASKAVPEGFVLVEKCDIEMMLQLIDNSPGYKSAPNKDDTMKIVKNMLIRIGEAKFEGGVLSGN